MADAPTIPECDLALRAIFNHELKTFPIRDKMVIGSGLDCDIFVPDSFEGHVKIEIHHGICRLYPADSDIVIRDGANYDRAWLPLRKGSMFVVGKTIFDCVQLPPEELFKEYLEPPVYRHACPRCRANLLDVDLSASFCPHCGAHLPADCPAWPDVNNDAPPEPEYAWWMLWMPTWLRTRVARDPLFFARRTTVLAYINTLFNLGLKYEAGVEGDRNRPEALRYYEKAAHLGNMPARARLKSKQDATSNAQHSTSNAQC